MGRRQLTTAITLVVLVGILMLGAWAGMRSAFAPLPGGEEPSASPSPSCTTTTVKKGRKLRSSQVTVSVYNAGTRSGLAGKTQRALAKRGFKLGDVGNAPDGIKLRHVQVWTIEKGDAEAVLVARQFGKDTEVKLVEEDLGPGVDVLVGNDFNGLKKASRTLRLKSGEELCAG